jgi:hypothetical protein
MRSVQALLAGAIDYAGLFPPSAVSMAEAVLNYAAYRNTDYNWMLGRFVVAAARLDEFYETAQDFVSRDGGDPWRLAVVVGDDFVRTLSQVKTFNAEHGPGVVCDSVEVKADSVGMIENAAASLTGDIMAYFEIATYAAMPDLISAVAIKGQRAKIRTGGVTPEAFPKSDEIV